jgi:hypothetical protein
MSFPATEVRETSRGPRSFDFLAKGGAQPSRASGCLRLQYYPRVALTEG